MLPVLRKEDVGRWFILPVIRTLYLVCKAVLVNNRVIHMLRLQELTWLMPKASCVMLFFFSASFQTKIVLSCQSTQCNLTFIWLRVVVYRERRNWDFLCWEILSKVWSRPEDGQSCFAYCQEICLWDVCLPASFNFISPQSSSNTVSFEIKSD